MDRNPLLKKVASVAGDILGQFQKTMLPEAGAPVIEMSLSTADIPTEPQETPMEQATADQTDQAPDTAEVTVDPDKTPDEEIARAVPCYGLAISKKDPNCGECPVKGRCASRISYKTLPEQIQMLGGRVDPRNPVKQIGEIVITDTQLADSLGMVDAEDVAYARQVAERYRTLKKSEGKESAEPSTPKAKAKTKKASAKASKPEDESSALPEAKQRAIEKMDEYVSRSKAKAPGRPKAGTKSKKPTLSKKKPTKKKAAKKKASALPPDPAPVPTPKLQEVQEEAKSQRKIARPDSGEATLLRKRTDSALSSIKRTLEALDFDLEGQEMVDVLESLPETLKEFSKENEELRAQIDPELKVTMASLEIEVEGLRACYVGRKRGLKTAEVDQVFVEGMLMNQDNLRNEIETLKEEIERLKGLG